jgi:late competence protein required for DNA uptake (superfamily II DNA/RNA helicase)
MAFCPKHRSVKLERVPARVHRYVCNSCNKIAKTTFAPIRAAKVHCPNCSRDFRDKREVTDRPKTVYLTVCPTCIVEKAQ